MDGSFRIESNKSKSRVFRKEDGEEGTKRKSRKKEMGRRERGKERSGFRSPRRQEPRLFLDSLQKTKTGGNREQIAGILVKG